MPITNCRMTSLRLVGKQTDCTDCVVQVRCIGNSLSKQELQALSSIIRTVGPFKEGSAIFKMETPFNSLFAIQHGSVKIEAALEDGANLVKGFYFPGHLIGADAIGESLYQYDAIALEPTWVCELPFTKLEMLCAQIPKLQHEILILLARKIRDADAAVANGHHLNAEKKVLLFLQSLNKYRGILTKKDDDVIELPMSKGDIASYLGLRPESLSRALSKLQSEGVLINQARKITLLDLGRFFKPALKR